MKHPLACALALAIAAGAAGSAFAAPQDAPATGTAMSDQATSSASTPFATISDLSLHYPHFDRIEDAHFAPAFDRGMAEHLKEIEAIANNPEPATFDNTIVAMEKSGQLLDRATTVFYNLVGTDTNDTREALQSTYAPKFSAHGDAIRLNPKLFARIKSLYDQRASLGLDAEGVRLGEKEQLAEFYPQLGSTLKKQFPGWTAFIFSGDPDLAKLIRLKPSRKTVLYNGALECRLFRFDMVAGFNRREQAKPKAE